MASHDNYYVMPCNYYNYVSSKEPIRLLQYPATSNNTIYNNNLHHFASAYSDKYVTDAQNLHEHVMRHNHGTDENGTSINCLKIVFDTEYPL